MANPVSFHSGNFIALSVETDSHFLYLKNTEAESDELSVSMATWGVHTGHRDKCLILFARSHREAVQLKLMLTEHSIISEDPEAGHRSVYVIGTEEIKKATDWFRANNKVQDDARISTFFAHYGYTASR